ncbi:MAG: AsmA-like C-terminal region-containing protein, partial [Burkholderiaceae bacterium]
TRLELDLARKQSSGQGWLVHLGASGTLRGARVDGEFTGRPLALVAPPGTSPLALHLSVGDYRLQVEGQVAGAGTSLDLTVAASGPGTRKLSRLLGVDLPDLPSYAVSAKVNRTPDLLELTALKARVGKSRFTGKLALDRSGRRNLIRLDLEAGLLAYADFDQLLPGSGRPPELPKWLKGTDGRISMSADRLVGPKNAVYRQITLRAAADDAGVHVASLRFASGGGTVTANGTLNKPDSGRAAASMHAKVEHVRLSEALKPFGLGRRFPGVLGADIDFTTDPEKRVSDSTLRYHDPAAGTDIRLKLSAAPKGMQIRGRGRFLHDQFRIDGTAGPASGLAGPGPYPFDVEFKALETDGQLSGTIEQPLKFNGLKSTLAVRGPNPRRAEPALGFRMPELPPYSLNGTLTRQNGVWRFANIRGEVGNTDLSGWIRVDHTDSKPRVKAELHSDLLDFDDLGGIIGAAPHDGPGEVISPQQKEKARQIRERSTVLPDEAFEFPTFLGFDADVRYDAASVDSDKLPLDSLRLTFKVKNGRLRLSPLLVGAGGGVVRMDLRLVDQPSERPVHGHVTLDISRVSAAKLLRPFDIAQGSAGLISGHGQFTTRGESVAAMMASMDGQASLAMNAGRLNAFLVELAGLDGGEALLLGFGNRQTVDVNCAYIGSTVRRGKLEFDNAMIDTTDTRFTMKGAVDLARERFDLRILAHPKDASLFAARAPLLLEGTFRNPDFHPLWAGLLARGAAALALGAITPPAALLAFVEPGPGEAAAPCISGLPQ